MRRALVRPTARKSWFFSSVFNHFVLAVVAGMTIFNLQRGCAPEASPDPRPPEAARERTESQVLEQQRDQQLARLVQAEEQRQLDRARQIAEEKSERERTQRERKRYDDELQDLKQKIIALATLRQSSAERPALTKTGDIVGFAKDNSAMLTGRATQQDAGPNGTPPPKQF